MLRPAAEFSETFLFQDPLREGSNRALGGCAKASARSGAEQQGGSQRGFESVRAFHGLEAPNGWATALRSIAPTPPAKNALAVSDAVVHLPKRTQVQAAARFYEHYVGAVITKKYAVYEEPEPV